MPFLGHYQDVILDRNSRVVAGAIVTVTRWDGSEATIYSSRNGGQIAGSQVQSNDFGVFRFFARPGVYTLTVSNVIGGPVTIEAIVGGADGFTAEYFGVREGADGQDITNALQSWAYELLQHTGGVLPSGRITGGRIDLPFGRFITDSLIWHPALSAFGDNRAGTNLVLKSNATPVGVDAVRAMFYIVARAQETQATGAWMPAFKNLRLSGNKSNQSNQLAFGLYCENGSNDPNYTDYLAGGTELKSYSAAHCENVEIEAFSGTGIVAAGDRQRLMLFGRTRSINHGIQSNGVVVTDASGVRVLGNDPVISDCGFGGCTGHSVSIAGCSGLVMHGCNVWGTTSAARSSSALALHLQNVNGASIVGNVFNDTVSFYGSTNEDRSFSFIGNHLKPNSAVFASDGVPVGTADVSCNAFIRVRGYKNVVIGLNDFSPSSSGDRFEYLASFTDSAVGFLHVAASSSESPSKTKPWHSTQPIPVYVASGGSATVLMHDPARGMTRLTGQLVVDLGSGVEPDPAYSFVHGGAKPALLDSRIHIGKGDSLLTGKAQTFTSAASGGSYAIGSNRKRVTFYSANQIDTYSVTLPATPDDGHELELVFPNGVKALSLVMGDGAHTLNGQAITSVPPGTTLKLTFKPGTAPAGTWWIVGPRNTGSDPVGAVEVNMANAGTLQLDGANRVVHLTRATTCTQFTTNLPPAPVEAELRRLCIHQAVTTWALAPGAGHTLHATDTWPTSIPAGGYTLEVQFLDNVWYLVRKG